MRARIEPAPTTEEAVALLAALAVLREDEPGPPVPARTRSRWELAGRLGHPLPQEMEVGGPLWPRMNRGRSV
ncbi:MAG: hypothetical protein H0V53_00850 [Rubrobacter sp.]|nr:hypothetical protein [Rubrobacter sp.]